MAPHVGDAVNVSKVSMGKGVICNCINHAFISEGEEIMGLLLGDVEDDGAGGKDRVECDGGQMAEVAKLAEKLSADTGRVTRVVGWYHSHPHITVLPSHVDIVTQAGYQAMDPGFVGIIVSCFNDIRSENVPVGSRLQVIAFQSVNALADEASDIDTSGMDTPTRRAILESSAEARARDGEQLVRKLLPVHIEPDATNSANQDINYLQGSLHHEEMQAYRAHMEALGRGGALSQHEACVSHMHAASVVTSGLLDLTQTALVPALAAARAARFALEARRADALAELQRLRQAAQSGDIQGCTEEQLQQLKQLHDRAHAQQQQAMHAMYEERSSRQQQPQHPQQMQQPQQHMQQHQYVRHQQPVQQAAGSLSEQQHVSHAQQHQQQPPHIHQQQHPVHSQHQLQQHQQQQQPQHGMQWHKPPAQSTGFAHVSNGSVAPHQQPQWPAQAQPPASGQPHQSAGGSATPAARDAASTIQNARANAAAAHPVHVHSARRDTEDPPSGVASSAPDTRSASSQASPRLQSQAQQAPLSRRWSKEDTRGYLASMAVPQAAHASQGDATAPVPQANTAQQTLPSTAASRASGLWQQHQATAAAQRAQSRASTEQTVPGAVAAAQPNAAGDSASLASGPASGLQQNRRTVPSSEQHSTAQRQQAGAAVAPPQTEPQSQAGAPQSAAVQNTDEVIDLRHSPEQEPAAAPPVPALELSDSMAAQQAAQQALASMHLGSAPVSASVADGTKLGGPPGLSLQRKRSGKRSSARTSQQSSPRVSNSINAAQAEQNAHRQKLARDLQSTPRGAAQLESKPSQKDVMSDLLGGLSGARPAAAAPPGPAVNDFPALGGAAPKPQAVTASEQKSGQRSGPAQQSAPQQASAAPQQGSTASAWGRSNASLRDPADRKQTLGSMRSPQPSAQQAAPLVRESSAAAPANASGSSEQSAQPANGCAGARPGNSRQPSGNLRHSDNVAVGVVKGPGDQQGKPSKRQERGGEHADGLHHGSTEQNGNSQRGQRGSASKHQARQEDRPRKDKGLRERKDFVSDERWREMSEAERTAVLQRRQAQSKS